MPMWIGSGKPGLVLTADWTLSAELLQPLLGAMYMSNLELRRDLTRHLCWLLLPVTWARLNVPLSWISSFLISRLGRTGRNIFLFEARYFTGILCWDGRNLYNFNRKDIFIFCKSVLRHRLPGFYRFCPSRYRNTYASSESSPKHLFSKADATAQSRWDSLLRLITLRDWSSRFKFFGVIKTLSVSPESEQWRMAQMSLPGRFRPSLPKLPFLACLSLESGGCRARILYDVKRPLGVC